MLLFGDCDPASQTCLDSKHQVFVTWLVVSVGLYLLTSIPLAVALFRGR